jgi:2-polyprenyl-3-methyl-5-hydroxy-6-metoxy-1,4-benzoquinol methylase
MPKLELVIGPSRSGKTTYARNREGYTFVCYDDLLYHHHWDFASMKNQLVDLLNDHANRSFILDGWFSKYNRDPRTVLELKQRTKRDVTLTCFYAPVEELLKRTECETRDDIVAIYRSAAQFYRNDLHDLPFEFRSSDKEFSFSEFMHLIRPELVTVPRDEVLSFISELEALEEYDRYYQTIELPYGITLEGYERTALAWEMIAQLVDFRGKNILDAGCYHGFCCRAAEDAGARRVVGLDSVVKILENAKCISDMWGYETSFIHADLDDWKPDGMYDIVMCLNTIQYCKQPRQVTEKLFNCGSIIIMEAHREFKKLFSAVSTHQLIHEAPSPRAELKRAIYIYKSRTNS